MPEDTLFARFATRSAVWSRAPIDDASPVPVLELLQSLDETGFRWLNRPWGWAGDELAKLLTDFSALRPWVGLAIVAALVRGTPRLRATLALVGLLLSITDPLNRYLVKRTVLRPRPCKVLTGVTLREERCPQSTSFTSSHAVNSAAAATLIGLRHPMVAPFGIVVALAVGASRVHNGVHYPGDVLGGFLLGAVAALSVHRVARGSTAARAADSLRAALHRLRPGSPRVDRTAEVRPMETAAAWNLPNGSEPTDDEIPRDGDSARSAAAAPPGR